MTGEDKSEGNRACNADAIIVAGLATSVGALVGTIIYTPNDPLKPILTPDQQKQVTPDKLAEDIVKDPKLQQRWKLMREFVERVDREMDHNLEQSAGESKETARHWKGRVKESEDRGPTVRILSGPGEG